MMKKEISILIAEGDTDVAQLLAAYFIQQGFNPCIASNGAIAKEKILLLHFDFLIIDVLMPEVDGLQLLSWLNQRSLTVNVIVTSGLPFNTLPLPNKDNIIMKVSKPYNRQSLSSLCEVLTTASKNK